eukprot:COSAG03_NODE_1572_length_3818_cov_13.549521_4_plen_321_part_00
MQLRDHYTFGQGLKDIDLQLSARGHHPGFRDLESWYQADAQSSLRAELGRLPTQRALRDWQHAEGVVAAYWADPRNLRRGFQPPDVDYAGSTHLKLEDGSPSLLQPRPPTGGQKPRALAGGSAASPRERALADGGEVTPRTLAFLDAAGFVEDRVDSPAPPPDYEPSFPTLGYWLPPLSRPLTSVTHQADDTPLKQQNMIRANHHQRRDPHLPATWSLSPTPLSAASKPRYATVVLSLPPSPPPSLSPCLPVSLALCLWLSVSGSLPLCVGVGWGRGFLCLGVIDPRSDPVPGAGTPCTHHLIRRPITRICSSRRRRRSR